MPANIPLPTTRYRSSKTVPELSPGIFITYVAIYNAAGIIR